MRFDNDYVTNTVIEKVIKSITEIDTPPPSIRWWVRRLAKLDKDKQIDIIKEVIGNYIQSIKEFSEERCDIKLEQLGTFRYNAMKEEVYNEVIAIKNEAVAKDESVDLKTEFKEAWNKRTNKIIKKYNARVNAQLNGKVQPRRDFDDIIITSRILSRNERQR